MLKYKVNLTSQLTLNLLMLNDLVLTYDQSLQQAEAHNFLAPSRGQSSVNPHLTQHPMTGHMLLAVHNAGGDLVNFFIIITIYLLFFFFLIKCRIM